MRIAIFMLVILGIVSCDRKTSTIENKDLPPDLNSIFNISPAQFSPLTETFFPFNELEIKRLGIKSIQLNSTEQKGNIESVLWPNYPTSILYFNREGQISSKDDIKDRMVMMRSVYTYQDNLLVHEKETFPQSHLEPSVENPAIPDCLTNYTYKEKQLISLCIQGNNPTLLYYKNNQLLMEQTISTVNVLEPQFELDNHHQSLFVTVQIPDTLSILYTYSEEQLKSKREMHCKEYYNHRIFYYGQTITNFYYDTNERLLAINNASLAGRNYLLHYDKYGRLDQITEANGFLPAHQAYFIYNKLGRLSSIWHQENLINGRKEYGKVDFIYEYYH